MAETTRFQPQVAADLAEAIAWYEEKSIGVANRFRAAVRRGLNEVAKYPNLCPIAFGDVRFRRVGKFPYLILYRITPNVVHIIGIVHSASDPAKWRSRADES